MLRESGVTRWIQRELSLGVSTGTGMTSRLLSPRSSAMIRMISRYDKMSSPPMSRVFPVVSFTARQSTRYRNTLSTAIGWHSVATHFGVIMTGRRSTR